MVKNPPAIQEMWVQSLGQEDLLEKAIAIHSTPAHVQAGNPMDRDGLLGYSCKVSDTAEATCTPMSITASITATKIWKQPKYPTRDD